MGTDHPLLLLAMIGLAGFLAGAWWRDLQAARDGCPNPHAFPGARPANRAILGLAVAGTLVLVLAETAGEIALGLAARQSEITVLFALYTLAAAFIEELVFRGYLVVTGRGRAALLGGIVLASALFATLHPYLWRWTAAGLVFTFDAKAWYTTMTLFVGSLWFYALRFLPMNPHRSLVPCIVAHLTKNLAVFAVKCTQGFVSGWW
jgi:membrane protease YdiL (CAAX protease family)